MTTQTYPHRIVTIAISVVSILLVVVLLLLLLVILWRSKPPSFIEKDVCLHENATTDQTSEDVNTNIHVYDSSLIKKTETRNHIDSDSIDHAQQLRLKSLLPINNNNYIAITDDEIMKNDTQSNKNEDNYTWGVWKNEILPNTKGDFEYIRPLKLSRNQYEDPIDDEPLSAMRHHSGHFRHSSAKVWDPHPQYEFTAFGRKFRLRLAHDSGFVFSNIKVTHVRSNITKFENPSQHLGCLYTGTVDGDPNSIVSVSLCHGMTGHMKTSTGNYFIKPTEQWSNNKSSPIGSSLQHAILRVHEYSTLRTDVKHQHTSNDISSNNHECAVIDDSIIIGSLPSFKRINDDFDEMYYTSRNQPRNRKRRHLRRIIDSEHSMQEDSAFLEHDENTGQKSEENHMNNYISKEQFLFDNKTSSNNSDNTLNTTSDIYDIWRRRRALPSREYFIEIMVVADATMVDYHNNGLFGYILVLLSAVSRIYKDPSIGNPISIALVKIVTTDEIFVTKYTDSDGISAAEMLKKFCHWQKRNNPHEPSPQHHDVALLLTRENLCHNPDQNLCDTLGLAELGRMCSPGSSCAIVQDNGLAAAFTIAHEIGHVLNMPHDDDSKCSGFRNRSGVHYIMSRMLDDNTFPWEWSKCSRHYITEFLDAGLGNCLLDEPNIMMTSLYNRLPGEDYSENKQCELAFGPGSKACSHMVSDVCKKLWCTAPYWDKSQGCHSQHMPWADGTSCGINKWCHRGECVYRKNLAPIDGQWSEWSRYSECSRTCGGGIKTKVRECNNPPPKNGGNYCVGERIKYRSCGTKECPPGSPDFREEQCSKFNNDNQNIQNLARDVIWHAKYTRILPEDRCKLYCQVESNQYYMLENKVIDGTTCSPDTFHMCVNGRCKPAGCDHVLNSTAEIDTCGVCRGNNSTCERITGSYNSSEYGYKRVTKIPAGSSYIDIKQYSWSKMANDSNYLALRIGENGRYILNGNFMVMHRKVIVQPGVTIEYSGPEAVIERLNSSRPITVDLVVEVLSVGNVLPPQITYEYTVPKNILYGFKWALTDWTECDRVCLGTHYRKAECRGFENSDIVSDDYCRNSDKPEEESRTCNQHCTLQWQVLSVSECSSHCGPGIRKVTYRCIQIISSSTTQRPIPPHACSHLKHDSEQQMCIGSCKDAHWRYGEWTTCSATCGGGLQMRSAACMIDSNQEIVPDDKCSSEEKIVKRICGQETCPKWDFADWTPCSVTCGIGWRERPYWCQVDNHVVPMSNCKGLPPQLKEACDAGPCYRWYAGNWSSCSVTCGEGIRRRTVTCKNVDNVLTAISNQCDPSTKPIDVTTCTSAPCPLTTTALPSVHSPKSPINASSKKNSGIETNHIISYKYEWHIVNYGKCSKSCGGGTANRLIKCISIDTKMAFPNNFCNANSRPSDIVSCNKHLCPKWDTGDWSQCSVRCGEGYQGRQVRCRSWTGHVLRDNECSLRQKPRSTRKCQRYNCGTIRHYKWRTANWSDCSATCGKGVQTRNVTCHRVNPYGWIDPIPTEGCTILDKPNTRQTCKLRDCSDEFYWSTGNWRKCSHPCGKNGQQTRRLYCHDKSDKKVPRYNCTKESKPRKKRKCNQRKCGPQTCLEIKKRFGSIADGEYKLLVGGRNMSIYCHEMNSNNPKEYLTLPAGDQENYSEIYDKRLLNPQTCPFNGKRNDSCLCVSDEGTISGKTMFKRLRIDVSKLYIIVDDYTFSWTSGAKRVEFGKAGDCYSLKNCPQGSFSINLHGTYLKISSEVMWTTQKMKAYHFINRISDQLIVGKCGGYCGFCTPSAGLKLDVLPP